MPGKNGEKIRCSFCNKTEDQVRKLIADAAVEVEAKEEPKTEE